MPARSTPWPLALSLLLAAGCVAPPGRVGPPDAPGPRASAAPSARTSPATGPTPAAPGVVPAPSEAPGLAGVVRAPARILAAAGILSNNGGSIISDNGGGIISDNGGGILSNNGGSIVAPALGIPAYAGTRPSVDVATGARYRALAVEQAPAAGVVVRLTDAAGSPQAGPDGRPLEARTDAAGRYRFPGLTAGRNLIVVAELPAGQGAILAVAPRGGGAPVDLDLASTLAAGYIQGRYLAGQADPNGTFERLTADAERETRLRAAAALARAADAEPARLTADAVGAAVDALRARDAGFDAQMERVRRLLLVAGLADLGAGQDARSVVFGTIGAVLPLPDGTLAIASPQDHRVWRVDAEGKLRTLVGTGRPDAEAARDGVPALDVPLSSPDALALDARGRLLVAEDRWVLRVEADGRVRAFRRPRGGDLLAVAGGRTDDEVLALVRGAWPGGSTSDPAWEHRTTLFALGAAPVALPDPGFWTPPAAGADEGWVDVTTVAARVGEGPLLVLEAPDVKDAAEWEVLAPDAPLAHAFDLAAGTRLAPPPVAGARIGLAPDGTWFARLDDGTLVATPAAGEPVSYPPAQLAGLPAALRAAIDGDVDAHPAADAFAWAGGGRAYVRDDEQVWELGPGGLVRHVAGAVGAADRPGEAAEVDLSEPLGAAVGPDGAVTIVDAGTRRLLRRDAAGRVVPLAGAGADAAAVLTSRDGSWWMAPSDGSAPEIPFGPNYAATGPQAWFAAPTIVRAAGADALVLDADRFVRRVGPDGAVSTVFVAPAGERIVDVVRARDGATWYLARANRRAATGARNAVVRRAADGTEAVVGALPTPPGYLALQPDGTAWVVAGDTLYRREGEAWKPVATDERLDLDVDGDVDQTSARLAVDAAGHAYFAAGDAVLRLRPGARAWDVLAGPGGRLLPGARPDDGVGEAVAVALDDEGGLYLVDLEFEAVRRLAPPD